MAKSTSGNWVSRVGASGGGKTYKKARPSNFYGALAVIVVLGVALVIFSRYEYQNPHHAKSVAPAVGTTWYGALSIQTCGTDLPFLATDPTYVGGGFTVQAADVIKLKPVSSADAGNNATLAQFVKEYSGLVATSTELAVPTATHVSDSSTTYKNGDVCAMSTKDAGKKGDVVYAYWDSLGQKKPTLTTDPASIKFVKDIRITMAFEPKGVTPSAPSSTTVDAMFTAATTSTTTTTTTLATTTTTGATTTTTAPTTTTTKG